MRIIRFGQLTRTKARAFSTPSILPHNDTWLLFSVWLERLESGKWIWVNVSSMIFLILLPPRPIIYEWSVNEISIFMITRQPWTITEKLVMMYLIDYHTILILTRESKKLKICSLAFMTPEFFPTMRTCGSENKAFIILYYFLEYCGRYSHLF